MDIGDRIKQLRIQNGLSVDDLAARLGKNRSTIYRYEKGDIEDLPASILEPLARALNTTPADLLGVPDEVETSSVFELAESDICLLTRFHKLNIEAQSRISDQIDFELFRQEKTSEKEEQNLG